MKENQQSGFHIHNRRLMNVSLYTRATEQPMG